MADLFGFKRELADWQDHSSLVELASSSRMIDDIKYVMLGKTKDVENAVRHVLKRAILRGTRAALHMVSPWKDQGLANELHEMASLYDRRPADGWTPPPGWGDEE